MHFLSDFCNINQILHWICIRTCFYPSAKSRRGIAMSMSVRPSVRPSVTPSVTPSVDISVFGQYRVRFFTNPCHLWFVGSLFCGSFNDFGEIQFSGPKRRALYRKYAISWNFTFFSVQGVFIHQISPFLVCIKLFCGSFKISAKSHF